MPLPPEVLEKIKTNLDAAETQLKSIHDVVVDLRASGIDAAAQEAEYNKLKDEYNKMVMFYGKQKARG